MSSGDDDDGLVEAHHVMFRKSESRRVKPKKKKFPTYFLPDFNGSSSPAKWHTIELVGGMYFFPVDIHLEVKGEVFKKNFLKRCMTTTKRD